MTQTRTPTDPAAASGCPFAGAVRTQATARSGQTNADW